MGIKSIKKVKAIKSKEEFEASAKATQAEAGKKKKKVQMVSYRLRSVDKSRLEAITAAVNDISDSGISETLTIKALILLASKAKPEKIYSLVKEVVI